MPTSPYARSLRQIAEGTQRLVNDYRAPASNGKIWTWAETCRAANLVLIELVRATGVLRGSAEIPILEGTNIYALPANCLRLLRVGITGTYGLVALPTTTSYVDLIGGARTATGDVSRFYREFLAPNQIGVLPIPQASGTVDGGNLELHFVRTPSYMVNAASYPDSGLPPWIHKDLKYGTAVQLIKTRREKLYQLKVQRFSAKWISVVTGLKSAMVDTGPISRDIRPQ